MRGPLCMGAALFVFGCCGAVPSKRLGARVTCRIVLGDSDSAARRLAAKVKFAGAGTYIMNSPRDCPADPEFARTRGAGKDRSPGGQPETFYAI